MPRKLVRYGIAGSMNAAVYIGLYTALTLLGVPLVVAAIVGFPPSVALGAWLHEHWTFKRGQPHMRGLVAFALTQVTALVLGVVLLIAVVEGLGADKILRADRHDAVRAALHLHRGPHVGLSKVPTHGTR